MDRLIWTRRLAEELEHRCQQERQVSGIFGGLLRKIAAVEALIVPTPQASADMAEAEWMIMRWDRWDYVVTIGEAKRLRSK